METEANYLNININDIKEEVGKKLMLSRKDKKLTIEDLAKKVNVAPSTISRYENGNCSMNLDIINKLLEGLDSNTFIFFTECFAKLQKIKINMFEQNAE